MTAVVLTGHGDFDRLEVRHDWPTPSPSTGEVLIRVAACGLNNTDVNTRTAWYSKGVEENTTGGAFDSASDDDATWGGAPLTFPRIQGADVCGKVVAVGDGADSTLIGKRVMLETWIRDWKNPMNLDAITYFGSECDGGFAHYTKIDQRYVHPIESDLSDPEIASFATSYVTAENMLNRAAVGSGDTVLVPGASGGVGGALIQLSKRRGARVVALCSESKREGVAVCGPDAILPREPDNLRAALRGAIGSDTVSVVADVVGGDLWPELINVLERGGRYTCAGAIAGPMVNMDLRTFYLRDLTFTGATIVPPGVFADLVGYIERGEIKPMVANVFPLENLVDAQKAFIAKQHVGNIVVDCR
ncbi:MAG: alcohol dehydrogenase [Kiloniella sp.]|nr:alcohol dehydrogenase [Kiloniella sp.]RZO30729.1 MAG: alcohol dehydrogenase [Rhodospirillaceae bacterium]